MPGSWTERLKATWPLSTILLILALPLHADTVWLSEPGYCDAPVEVIEDDSVMVLSFNGIRTHDFSCEWPAEAAAALFRDDGEVTVIAQCGNATGTWQATLDIVPQSDGALRVFQRSGGLSPVRFIRCDGS